PRRETPPGITPAMLRVAHRLPAWIDALAPAVQADVVTAATWMRSGIRTKTASLVAEAAGALERVDHDRAARVAFLELAGRGGFDPEVELRSHALHALLAERIALRAERLARCDVPAPLARGLAGEPASIGDAASIDRAIF